MFKWLFVMTEELGNNIDYGNHQFNCRYIGNRLINFLANQRIETYGQLIYFLNNP